MTVSDVSDHTGLNWKTVKNIDKKFLERDYGETDYNGLRILAVDEIALRKGHKYMTVVLDYESGRVVWMGLDRRYKTLAGFFKEMSEEQRSTIKAVGMDMWDPYIKAVKEYLPEAKIVFDLFHMVSAYGRLIDKVRNSEKKKASKEDKSVYKGTKYLLLKNRVRKHCHKQHLKELLELNETISTVYILKEKLKNIWKYKYRACAKKCLEEWCSLARSVEDPELDKFANTLENQAYGIINHCDYPIHTSKLEGVNNKIKVIKRKAYGYHDSRYFMLKVKQAFDNRANSLFGR
jgi:transposase